LATALVERGYGDGSTPGAPAARVASRIVRAVSTIDVKTRSNSPIDITVGAAPLRTVFTP
jgi:hypothetical protein